MARSGRHRKRPLFPRINRHGQPLGRLSPQGVAIVLKRALLSAGLDASGFSGHSLRAGHATQAALNAASERAISNQTGHKSLATLRRYIRTADAFRENPAKSLGL